MTDELGHCLLNLAEIEDALSRAEDVLERAQDYFEDRSTDEVDEEAEELYLLLAQTLRELRAFTGEDG